MKRDEFLCDSCGARLGRYGERYTLRVEPVPATRGTTANAYDLCPSCAKVLTQSMEARPWLMWTREGG